MSLSYDMNPHAAVRQDTRSRPYRMSNRAAAAEQTAQDILEATVALYSERFFDQVALEDVAERAGVTVRTVLRRFESKDRLLDAAGQWAEAKVESARAAVDAGDVAAAVSRAVDDYERHGDAIMRWLGQEERVPLLRRLADRGRRLHHEWVERVFAPQLARRSGADRRRLYAQLVAATDVYTWKLLRRDLRLGRSQTERAIGELVAPLVGDSGAQRPVEEK
jgi:AcrR family transcriptional regulator